MRFRAYLAAVGCGAFFVAGFARASVARDGNATAFVQETASRLTTIIDGDGDQADKARKLQIAVDDAVDTEEIARFCLGRFWRAATPDQRKTFVQIFHRVLLDGMTGQIGAYKGVRVTTGVVLEREGETVVPSVIDRPGQKAVQVNWLVRPTSAGLRIEDVVAEGMSLRLTRRNDYTAFLSAHGGDLDALLEAMRERLERK